MACQARIVATQLNPRQERPLSRNESPNRLRDCQAAPPSYARNAWSIAGDIALFNVGIAFISQTVVLPSFVAALSNSEVVVGLASALLSGAWLLPQLLVAGKVAPLPRKMPVVLRAALLGRLPLPLVAVAIWLLGAQRPALTLAIGLTGLFFLWLLDGVASVPWFDVYAKVIPLRRRGRVTGVAQFAGGVAAVGSGLAVRFILGEESPWAFPTNYALLFALASIVLLAGLLSLSFVREPESRLPPQEVPSAREVLALLPNTLAHNRPFLKLVMVRLLSRFASVASAFYVLYATRGLGLGSDAPGLFVSAQVIGSLAAGLLTSVVQDRWGPVIHMRVVAALAALPPIIALSVGHWSGALGRHALYPYLLIYLFLGVSAGSMSWPHMNWLLECVDEEQRPFYIGALNTLGAVAMLAPAVGGLVVGVGSYSAVFALALLFSVGSLLASLSLPDPRQ